MMRNRTGQTITDYAGLLAEALPLLDLPTDPVTLGGWNGGDADRKSTRLNSSHP